MDVKHIHDWDLSYKQAAQLQSSLARQLSFTPLKKKPKLIAGLDCAFSKDKKKICAVVIVLSFPDMEIVENHAYHRLCLFYKGELDEADLIEDGNSPANAATAYGIANWHLAEGDAERAAQLLEEIIARYGWAAFGTIAAEADLARMRE